MLLGKEAGMTRECGLVPGYKMQLCLCFFRHTEKRTRQQTPLPKVTESGDSGQTHREDRTTKRTRHFSSKVNVKIWVSVKQR